MVAVKTPMHAGHVRQALVRFIGRQEHHLEAAFKSLPSAARIFKKQVAEAVNVLPPEYLEPEMPIVLVDLKNVADDVGLPQELTIGSDSSGSPSTIGSARLASTDMRDTPLPTSPAT